MKKSDCEICKHWAASQSNDFPCDGCDGMGLFIMAEERDAMGRDVHRQLVEKVRQSNM